MRLLKHLRYARYIIIHKYHVAVACALEGIPIRGLTHDWHKMLPSEWGPYVEAFYGEKIRGKAAGKRGAAFDRAWLSHQNRAKHHWQWWLLQKDSGVVQLLPMSHAARLEMVCDWYGAGKAMGKGGWPHTLEWYLGNKERIHLHPRTRRWVEVFLRKKSTRATNPNGWLRRMAKGENNA